MSKHLLLYIVTTNRCLLSEQECTIPKDKDYKNGVMCGVFDLKIYRLCPVYHIDEFLRSNSFKETYYHFTKHRLRRKGSRYV